MEKISKFVKDHLGEMARHPSTALRSKHPSPQNDPVYRWDHTLRVAQYGEQLAKAEGADIEEVVAACLLHDVAHFEPLTNYKDHGREGARMSRALLVELGYSEEQVGNICYAIAAHVDDKADFEHEHTLEAEIVSDADNIDRFGAYRILQWCVPEMDDFPALAEKLSKRAVHLEGYLQDNPLATEAGRALFAKQLKRQIAFFKDLVAEYELSKLPQI
jgi:uncharacterized protein